jgi:hypothetical protein
MGFGVGDFFKTAGVSLLFGGEIGNAYFINKVTGQGGLSEVFGEDIPRSMLFGGRPSQWAALDAVFGERWGGQPQLPFPGLYYGAPAWGMYPCCCCCCC